MKHGWFKETANHYVLFLDGVKVGWMKVTKEKGFKAGTPNSFSLTTEMKYWRGCRGKSYPFISRKSAQDQMHTIMNLHKIKYGKVLESWNYSGK